MSWKIIKLLAFVVVIAFMTHSFDAAANIGDREFEKSAPTTDQPLPEKEPTSLPKTDDDANDTATDTEKTVDESPKNPVVRENNDEDKLTCLATPYIEPQETNQKPIGKSNNLRRKAGSPLSASGEYVHVKGLVVDENCLPIQGAVIQIWQTDDKGHYEWEYDSHSYWELPLAGKDNNFLFSGSAQTDNLGQFNFLTIFPGGKGDAAPFLNVIVKRTGYDELHTRMYFAGQASNQTDPILSTLKEKGKQGLTAKGRDIDPNGQYAGKVYFYPVTMRGINVYKRF